MANLARIQTQASRPVPVAPRLVPAPAPVAPEPDFSRLEWSIIRLARVDSLATLHEPGPVQRFFNWLMGRKGSSELANPKLEALRRIAVLSWHFGFTIPGDEVAAFVAAGFTLEQYELLVLSIRAAISAPSQGIH